MTPERWRQVEELYLAAVARRSATRAPFLKHTGGHDIELQAEVESLLKRNSEAAHFLESRSLEAPRTDLVGKKFGSYTILSVLGVGGMGEVYRARDQKLERDVALKTLTEEFSNSPEQVARLRREARILALLNDPNIASIYGLEESDGVTNRQGGFVTIRRERGGTQGKRPGRWKQWTESK